MLDQKELKKQLIREAWKRGHLSYKLRPHQQQVYDALWKAIESEDTETSSYSVLCARRFGKSFIALLVAFEFGFGATQAMTPKENGLFGSRFPQDRYRHYRANNR